MSSKYVSGLPPDDLLCILPTHSLSLLWTCSSRSVWPLVFSLLIFLSASCLFLRAIETVCCTTTIVSPLTHVCHPQVFSCRLGSEQETALSIIDPVNIQVELCGSPTYQSSSGLLDAFNVEDIPPLLEVEKTSEMM